MPAGGPRAVADPDQVGAEDCHHEDNDHHGGDDDGDDHHDADDE